MRQRHAPQVVSKENMGKMAEAYAAHKAGKVGGGPAAGKQAAAAGKQAAAGGKRKPAANGGGGKQRKLFS